MPSKDDKTFWDYAPNIFPILLAVGFESAFGARDFDASHLQALDKVHHLARIALLIYRDDDPAGSPFVPASTVARLTS